MNPVRPDNMTLDPDCRAAQGRLAAYSDGALAAREAWETEKHLAACALCARAAREMGATVDLLRLAPLRDTGDDFMARLHARLDGLEPEAARRRTPLEAARDWLVEAGGALRQQRGPALGFGFAASALVLVMFTQRPGVAPAPGVAPPFAVTVDAEPLKANAALSAGDPFTDPVAATLEAHAADSRAGGGE